MKHMHATLLTLFMGATSLGGCGVASLRVEPVKKDVAVVTPRFARGVYRVDRDRNLFFVLQKHEVDKATHQQIDQYVLMRIFWEPLGGTTSLNHASLNATFRYIVMTPDAVGMYEGAGFVRMSQNYGSPTMKARVVDGELRLTESSANYHDALGRARFIGGFTADYSDALTLDQTLGAQRDFFARSLAMAKDFPATQPATEPATGSATGTAPATMPTSP